VVAFYQKLCVWFTFWIIVQYTMLQNMALIHHR